MPPCPHREQTPRRCKVGECGTWLSSANPTDRCWVHGGWPRLDVRSPWEAMLNASAKAREYLGDVMAA